MNRAALATLLIERLSREHENLRQAYQSSRATIGHFVLDDAFPLDVAHAIHTAFPHPGVMTLKKSPREHKYITAQMDQYDPLLEEAIYAFQDSRVVQAVSELTGIEKLLPDELLYAGGISMMGNKHFLNPHIDNSHDKDRKNWRVFNLLYYVSPDWQPQWGGSLELWPHGVSGDSITLHNRFNRLAVMATHRGSWHSVSPIVHDRYRCCVSNYYFSPHPLRNTDRFHVTRFRGRPNQFFRDCLLRADGTLRTGLRLLFKNGLAPLTHVYRR